MATGKMNSPNQVSVGTVSTGMYLPDRVLTASDIAEQSGLPEWVVRDKLGINEKRMAGPDDHPNQMVGGSGMETSWSSSQRASAGCGA